MQANTHTSGVPRFCSRRAHRLQQPNKGAWRHVFPVLRQPLPPPDAPRSTAASQQPRQTVASLAAISSNPQHTARCHTCHSVSPRHVLLHPLVCCRLLRPLVQRRPAACCQGAQEAVCEVGDVGLQGSALPASTGRGLQETGQGGVWSGQVRQAHQGRCHRPHHTQMLLNCNWSFPPCDPRPRPTTPQHFLSTPPTPCTPFLHQHL